jgi:hypothetical protein
MKKRHNSREHITANDTSVGWHIRTGTTNASDITKGLKIGTMLRDLRSGN